MKRYLQIILTGVIVVGFSTGLYAGSKSIVKVGSDVHITVDMRVDDAVSIGGDVQVDGIVDGDAVAIGGSVHLGEEAVIHGDAVTVGGNIDQAEGAMIYGTVVDVSDFNFSGIFRNMDIGCVPGFHWAFKVISLLGLIALVLLLGAIIPKELNTVVARIEEEPVKMFLFGILGILLIVPLAVLLAISIVGIALIPIEILAVFLAMLIGYIAVAIILGRKLLTAMNKIDPSVILSAIVGVLVLWAVGLIPFIGSLVKFIAALLGFGAVIVAVARRNKKPIETVAVEVAKEL